MASACEHEYLIIGGTTKAGTTSVFSYLAEHPDIAPASVKETRFFLDRDYPVDFKYRYNGGLDAYNHYFLDKRGGVRLEATPDYLHSPGTAERIARSLPRARLAFILRDPVARVISWYNFGRQRRLVSKETSFADYVNELKYSIGRPDRPQWHRVLEQGCYTSDVKRFLEQVGPDRIRFFFFEHFVADPGAVVRELCEFSGIDPTFFVDYAFDVHNRTGRARSVWLHRLYTQLCFHVRGLTRDKRSLRRVLRGGRRRMEPLYDWLNSGLPEQIEDSSEPAKWLLSYYCASIEELEAVLGTVVPWPRFQRAGTTS